MKKITRTISENISSTVQIGGIEFRFFNKLLMNDVLVLDKNSDTLLYTETLSAGIRKLDFKKNIYSLGRVTFVQPEFALITDTSNVMNLKWYIEMLKSKPDSVQTKKQFTLLVNRALIANGKFSLVNHNKENKSRTPIDFNDMHLSSINGMVNAFSVKDGLTSFKIKNLSFKELSGFHIKRFNSDFSVCRDTIKFNSTFIDCGKSRLTIDHFNMEGDSINHFKEFTKNVNMDLLLDESQINTTDLQYFIAASINADENISMSGKVHGPLSELRGRHIQAFYGDTTKLNFDFDISGLPSIDNAFIHIGMNDMLLSANDIEKIHIQGKDTLILPDLIHKIEYLNFNGNFTGFITNFVAFGNFNTPKGSIATDIALKPEGDRMFSVKGLVNGRNIDIGYLTDNENMLGKISMNADIDGHTTFKKFSGKLTGIVDSLDFNRYRYQNIRFNGTFAENIWDGSIKIAEKNLSLDLLGLLSFNKELPEFDFTLNIDKANLYRLNFDKEDTSAALSLLLTANFKGNNIDNLDGEIRLLNSTIRRNNNIFELYDFSLNSYYENDMSALSLRTDYMDADVRGHYATSEIGLIFKKLLASMIPSRYKTPSEKLKPHNNEFTFKINFKNTDKLNDFFKTGIYISEKSHIDGIFIQDSIIKVTGNAKSFSVKNFCFNDFTFSTTIDNPLLYFNIGTSSLRLPWNPELKGFEIDLAARPDTFDIDVNWDNKSAIKNYGTIQAQSIFSKPEGRKNAILQINIDSSSIYSDNNLWKINKSDIYIDSSYLAIHNFFINHEDKYYRLNGSTSKSPADTLTFKFRNINLSPVNKFTSKPNKPNAVPLNIKGIINGDFALSDLYHNLLIECNIDANDFSLLNSDYGKLTVSSLWNSQKKVIEIAANNKYHDKKMIDINGFYNPSSSEINLDCNTDKLPINILNPFISSFASDITGTASGKVNLSGKFKTLSLNGVLFPEESSIKIDFLNSTYQFNDSIRFNDQGILFKDIVITDENGNNGRLNGYVRHDHFKDFTPDLSINLKNNLVLNTKAKDNEYFYGSAIATGVTTIKKENTSTIAINASAKTGHNTKIHIPLNSGETVSDNSFISFIGLDTTSGLKDKPALASPPASTDISMNLDIGLTPDAEIQLIFDSKTGDIMKVHGSGDLNISLNHKNDLKISGDYIIDEGNYLFTLGNILNKSFSVKNGGKITFNGNLNDAEIDIQAIYKVRTSLYEILQDEKFSDRIPVECQLNLSGKLFNPIVRFDIYLPNAAEETRTYLKNVISTDEELSRQFLYLLVMNSFYSDPSYSSTTAEATTGTSAMALTTTEMLSNQLSNWLSQISNDFDIGFVYRPGYKDINSQELQVALSTQVLNDRVTINGNFDLSGSSNETATDNSNPITGDFDIEYKITERIRFKVFNRFNNPYTGRQADYTQGIGLFYRQEFDKFADLFRKKEKEKTKKNRKERKNKKDLTEEE